VPGASESSKQQRGADDVEDVIDVEAVSRPLGAAHAGHGAVEAVAEPVHRQCRDGNPERRRPDACCRECCARSSHCGERQQRKVVRVNPAGQTMGHPYEEALLGRGEQAAVVAVVLGGTGEHGVLCPPMCDSTEERLSRQVAG
jgi:hypothetical protein